MSTNTPDQQITIPVGPDLANNPLAFTDMIADVETRLVLKYTNEADRTARHTAPVEGDVTDLAAENRRDCFEGAVYYSDYTRGLFTKAFRTTDAAPINGSTTLVSDAVLLSALPTAGTFMWEAMFFYDSSQTADFKVAYTWPAGAVASWGMKGLATTATATTGDGQFAVQTASGTATPVGGAAVGTRTICTTYGHIVMGGTAGNLQTQYAQNTSDATNTTVRIGSRLLVWRVA
jgi:hypothetical protein